MIRLLIALSLLTALAGAEEILIPLRRAPEPVLVERAAAFDGYLAGAEERLHRYLASRPVKAPAGDGVLGWLGISIGAWFPTIDGDFRAEGNDISVDELRLDDTEVSIYPEIFISISRFGIRFDGFLLETEGRSTLTRDIVFGGFTFTVNADVDSKVELNNFRLLGTFAVVETGPVELHVQFGLSVFAFDGQIENLTIGRASESATIPIPVIGILARAKLGPIMVELDITGVAIDYGDVEGSTFDVQISAGWSFLKIVSVRAGYRIIVVDGSADDLSIDVTISGFFVGARLSF